MEWYYAEGEERMGPFDEEEFSGLVSAGRVNAETYVWNSEMGPDWVPYREIRSSRSSSTAVAGAGERICVECGRPFPADEVIEYQGDFVCGECKPIFLQRLQEGGLQQGDFEYGGFLVRVGAKFLDGIITYVASFAVMIPIGIMSATAGESSQMMVLLVSYVASFGIPLVYSVFFLGKFGATPGKMALGLKVVRSDGEPITYLRALGRYFAEILSSIILMIGYIMAAFDSEKRALHDHICDTRVIKTR